MKNRTLTQKLLLGLGVLAAFSFASCQKDSSQSSVAYPFSNSIAIANEGAFGSSNATLSLYYPSGDNVVNEVFKKVNNRPLGDVFQSIGFAGDKAFLVLNGSNKIEIVNASSCKEVATIENISSPRYVTALSSSKAYVSLWGDGGHVAIIDVATNSISNTIKVGTGPEKMVIASQKLFVANSGGWGTDNTISVVNTQTDVVDATITVGDNPKDMVLDKNGKLWVLCAGNIVYDVNYNVVSETPSMLERINPSTNQIEFSITLGATYHPAHLAVNPSGDVLYYGGDYTIAGIFSFSIDATTTMSTPLINDSFYGFSVNPSNGEIIGLLAPTFTQPGTMNRYTSDGTFIKSYTVGIGPNSAYFSN
ncbi:MAG TPA: DUF5074 domain-containing protein [Williamwhitmania sp.]|nr:DUF5074 domain-containing protein [Williamwhitmania sp.]